MPINPFNYNIDYFDSVNLGPITDSNFLNYLVSHNLQNIEPAIANTLGITNPVQAGRGVEYDVSQSFFNVIDTPDVTTVSQTPSVYNNFTSPLDDNLARNPTLSDLVNWYPNYYGVFDQEFNDYKTQYSVGATLQLGFVGNVENWFQDGLPVNRNDEIISNEKKTNKYGPTSLVSYDSDIQEILVKANTGLIQYNTGIQGDFRDEIFNRTLGVGIIPFSTVGSGINYKPDGQNISELDKIARERRGFEVKERIRINFIDETIGSVNLNPLSLLTGNDLFQRDFAITRPARFIGRAAQFLSDLGGFTLPTSILQDYDFNLSIFNKDGELTNQADPNNLNEIDVKSSLLNRTGKATREILFDNIKNNKYGPNFDEDYELKNEGTYFNLLAETPLEGKTEDRNGGFYGKYETFETVGRSLSEKAGYSQENTIFEFEDYSKDDTTYNGTPTEQFTTTDQTGTIDEKFDWRVRDKVGFTKGILSYTQNLVNKSKRGDAGNYIGYFNSAEAFDGKKTYSQREDGYGHSTGAKSLNEKPTNPSEGNTARNYDFENNTGGEYYCRSWSSRRKYHTWNNLLRKSSNWWRVDEKFKSDMTMGWGKDPLGVPKIAYEKGDADLISAINAQNKLKGAAIPYMFSIENLAWKDAPQYVDLPDCEKGPNGGRLMWFPPYDINFSESNSVNWDSTVFIGRGENIYTYNNTERSGTLDFTIIVDHPTVLNQMRDGLLQSVKNDEPYHSFFAGCDIDTLKNLFGKNLTKPIQTNLQTDNPVKPNPRQPAATPINNIKIYFENSRTVTSSIGREVDLVEYEVLYPNIAPEGVNQSEWLSNSTLYPCANTYSYLNKGVEDSIDKLVEFLLTEDGKNYQINITSYTSKDNPLPNYNKGLANDRAKNTKNYIYNKLIAKEGEPPRLSGVENGLQYPKEVELKNNKERWKLQSRPNTESQDIKGFIVYGNPCSSSLEENDPNSRKSKEERYAIIELKSNLTIQNNLLQQTVKNNGPKKDSILVEKDTLINNFVKEFITECDYFEAMKREQPFVYNSLQEKIKYFHPAFHSMTPEGLNGRVTFLNQCTRQGPQTLNPNRPQNMVFGRPPICVLRIGDFYNTKIVIESININYEPLQWDLNPEGIGVQPMLAKISMSFKFIGGSSLGGPISQLQNAVSYNFYANTGVYLPANWEKALKDKQNFIYGSWLSPNDANAFYNPVRSTETPAEVQTKTETNDKLAVSSDATATKAPTSSSATTKIETSKPKPPPPASSGKPPSPPADVDLKKLKISAIGTAGDSLLTITVDRKKDTDNTALTRNITFVTAKLTSKTGSKPEKVIDISPFDCIYEYDVITEREYIVTDISGSLILEEGYDGISLLDDKNKEISGSLQIKPAGS